MRWVGVSERGRFWFRAVVLCVQPNVSPIGLVSVNWQGLVNATAVLFVIFMPHHSLE